LCKFFFAVNGFKSLKNQTLEIAGYRIRFEASEKGPDIAFGKRFREFSSMKEDNVDLLIKVHSGSQQLPADAQCLFHAPYVEEINGLRIEKRPDFWSVWKHNSDLFIKTTFPLSSPERKALLRFSLTSGTWDLSIDEAEGHADPMEYPLDGLILYYLTVMNHDVMIHASGVNNEGKGFIFSGISGKGKTTMAGLWHKAGAEVIHDDRLIVRKTSHGYVMYNTPVYENEVPMSSSLDRIFIIEHGKENRLTPVNGAEAVSLVMANCIQHGWGPEVISVLLSSVSDLCAGVPVAKLEFKPESDVIEMISHYE